MRKKLLYYCVLLIPVFTLAQKNQQFSAGFESNAQYYVDDNKTGNFAEDNRFRSNNYLKLDYQINHFQFGVQLESYLPQPLLNYSDDFNKEFGLATYYAQFKNKKIEALGGYFYGQFGSGLIYRSWEDRQLGLNNALLGGRIIYTPNPFLSLTGMYGKQRVGFEVSDGQVFGLNSEINLSTIVNNNSQLKIGLSYIGRNEKIENLNSDISDLTNAFSGRLNYSTHNVYTKLEYVYKSEDALVEQGFIFPNKAFSGNALLWNFGYSQKGLAADFTFRRLENMQFYSERQASGNLDNELLVNYLPSLTKQHDYNLTNIYVYQSQPQLSFFPLNKAGEIGYQMDVFYKIKKETLLGGKYGTRVSVNFSNWFGIKAEFDESNRTYNAEFLGFGERYFSDFNISIDKKWSKKWSSIFTYLHTFYSKKYIEEKIGSVNANTFIAETTYRFNKNKSTRLVLEHLSTPDDQKNWFSGIIEVNLSPTISIFTGDMYNYGNDRPIEQIHFYNFGGSFSKNNSRFAMSYGRQRGGLVCIGGVCRLVEPSTGLTLNVSTSF